MKPSTRNARLALSILSLVIYPVICENPDKTDLFLQDFALQDVFNKHLPKLKLCYLGY